MPTEFQTIFLRLRAILEPLSKSLAVKEDSATCYCLQANAGPAAVKAWGGEMRKPVIPIAWVEIGKAYVSFHLMGLYGNTRLLDAMSKELRARMQGKTCFNFTAADPALVKDLQALTADSIAAFKKAGFTS